MLQITLASLDVKLSCHIVPQYPLWNTSTRPSDAVDPLERRTIISVNTPIGDKKILRHALSQEHAVYP